MAKAPLHVGFGLAVRRLREERGVSQELGNRTGLHRNHIGQIERAELAPTLSSVEVIAAALGIRPSELVALAEELSR